MQLMISSFRRIKLSVLDETYEKIVDELNEYELYKLEKWVFMRRNGVSLCLNENSKYIYDIKIHNGMTFIHEKKINKIAKCN